jgi:hypothetical protein
MRSGELCAMGTLPRGGRLGRRTTVVLALLAAWAAALALAASLAALPRSASAAEPEDAYYNVPLADLKIIEGQLPGRDEEGRRDWRRFAARSAAQPYAVLEGAGEVYGVGPRWWSSGGFVETPVNSALAVGRADLTNQDRLVVRAPKGREVVGRIFFPQLDAKKSAMVKFEIPAGAATDQRQAFLTVKEIHYANLQGRNIPGAAWFRRQANAARAELGKTKPPAGAAATPPTLPQPSGELQRTYELFSGGRALRENLQLDRAILMRSDKQDLVPIASIRGITIREVDWKAINGDAKPKLDALASRVPADQHVVFFPSMRAAIAISDETRKHDLPLLRLAEPQSEDTGVIHRYQRQLGLPLSTLSRLLGPAVVRSIAVTGSDPFFPTGTDVAVLFESSQPAVLEGLLFGRVSMAATEVPGAKPIQGEVAGIRFRGFRSPDRAMSSYVARLSDAVVVTNSPHQLTRISNVAKGQTPSIASLAEFTFFRNRYKLGDSEETALLFLSDATIRRWCGPQWRIADSRRNRAAAVMADLQAGLTEAIASKTVRPGPLHMETPWPDLGETTVDAGGVLSAKLGTLDFLTPIAELPLLEVTKSEAQGYEQWREGYERNWRWAFDPVGFRISIGKNRLAGDLTVIPLIAGSEYREILSFTRGGKFAATAGDRHGALVHGILAVDKKSGFFGSADGFLSQGRSALSLGWVGPSIEVYLDDDPLWAELTKKDLDEPERFFEKNANRIPLAVRVSSENGFRLAAFLTSLRAFADQSSPDLTIWETRKHKDRSYVCVRARGDAGRIVGLDRIFYTTAGGALTVSLCEAVVQRVIDRTLAAEKPADDAQSPDEKKSAAGDAAKPAGAPPREWLGSNLGVQVDAQALQILNRLAGDEFRSAMQSAAWGNLPILNEWKRRFPDQDPVDVHRRVWGTTLQCPGGGKYVWNEAFQTLESTAYGHPGEPKDGPSAPPAMSTFGRANFGITFEHDGLRARMILDGEAAKPAGPRKK